MNKTKLLYTTGVILGLILLLSFLEYYLSGKIENQVGKSLSDYQEIDADFFQQKIQVKAPLLEKGKLRVKASEVFLGGFDYWNFISKNQLVISNINIVSPEITLLRKPVEEKKSDKKLGKAILIKDFSASYGVLRQEMKDSAGNSMYISFPELKISEVKIDSSTRGSSFPFSYRSYLLKGDSVAVSMNKVHFITGGNFSVKDGEMLLENFKIVPRYTKTEFDRIIPYEKDRIFLEIDQVRLDSLSFALQKDTLYLSNPLITVNGAHLRIYRNKLLADDTRTKSMYSEKIRNSPVKFDFEEIKVGNSRIEYEEVVRKKAPPAKIFFSRINGTVKDIINIDLDRPNFPKTIVQAEAFFMGSTPVTVDWSFNAAHHREKFLISGNFGSIQGDQLNPLLKPSLGIEAEGSLDSVFFTFSGNEEAGSGDVRVTYDKFKINILSGKKDKENKLLSTLANIFVNNSGLSEERKHHVQFTRDKSKSFWNYIWKGLKKGVIDALGKL